MQKSTSSKDNDQGPGLLDDLPMTKGVKILHIACRLKQKAKAAKERNNSSQQVIEMDYSDTYRENDVLEVDLEETLSNLHKDELRVLAEKGEEMDEVRRQMEMISRLQEVVNARTPGESADLLQMSRAARYGGDIEGSEFRDLTKMTKAQLRIAVERERFSAKNLFNNRRRLAHNGHELNTKLLPPSATLQTQSNDKGHLTSLDRGESHDNSLNSNSNGVGGSSNGLRRANSKTNAARPKSAHNSKGYLRETTASQKGRPVTAGVKKSDDLKYDDLLPPRSQSAFRSRSRRELEVLSRLQVKEDERTVDEDGRTNWRVVLESRRRRRLQELKVEGERLQGKVHDFLSAMDRFNKRPMTAWR